MTEPVTYAYAVLRDIEGLAAALDGVAGVVGAPVRLVRASPGNELAAAVSSVPAQDFQESALRRHLEDLDWLEAVARAHHTVIEALAAHTTVLPLRLATVYLDDRRVETMLGADAQQFSQAMRRLAGHLEWGVKIYVDRQPDVRVTGEAGAAATTEGLSPGRAYLRARRVQRHSRDESYRAARQAAEHVEAIGRDMAAGHARHQLQQGELATGAGENVVNDAYLLAHETAAEFRTRVLDAARGLPGVRIDVTGPWAPYSFASPFGAEGPAPDSAP
ncbi:GvpL/GvpF family gas vesicle protein [Streptomyces diastatochromogenes]|uniref:Gas vesicle protein n=1 Tax=Streptomyces diastatochromogenes TaxID=42236 RepID=A0A233RRL7_STRDA|nr:GvpL/GvpF family gas vesicle protein [Streptomyces diastatochromogenes]OXY86025.1 gas vesicle protein [Streptomyces diastatochromogenes]